ncbi:MULTISPECIES: DMT family protein [unclassified Legionella]|uniref:DMT family protein n=1 Tax=unclassified Legionella TaxID=2622702 RepID=UPI001055CCC3|nr:MULTISPECIES: DMT family protein [unclassified Legionella]MDI9818819.1 DMT family protein [Legionella sp. PL877]
MRSILTSILLLIGSNTFMLYAWYAHLKEFSSKPLLFVIIISWSIAFFEYLLQVPANRIGFSEAHLSLAQLKILQEVITLGVFLPFAVYYMGQKVTLNFLWAGLCLLGAVYFIFKPVIE